MRRCRALHEQAEVVLILAMDTSESSSTVADAEPKRRKLPRPTIIRKVPRTLPCPICLRLFNSPDAIAWHRRAKLH